MTKFDKLQQALAILKEELYPSALEIHLLQTRLSCAKCKQVKNILGKWQCNLYGPIPAEFLDKGCTNWELWKYPGEC